MSIAYLTVDQKDQLVGQKYAEDSYFNPINKIKNLLLICLFFHLSFVSLSMENIEKKEGSCYTILQFSHKNSNYIKFYDAICICGNKRKLNKQEIKKNISCGCVTRFKKKTTHGMSKTPEYKTWIGIKERCLNSNSPSYINYGGRGIDISNDWINNFQQFFIDMGLRPNSKYSIERIDLNKGYSKDNCIWATKKEQANNRRTNYLLTYKGQTKTRSQWADEIGVNVRTIASRCRANKTIEEILKEYGKS